MSEKIGILEDDPDLRLWLENVINESSEFELIFSVATLAEANQKIAQQGVDACLVDINLPDGSGIAFTEDLKSNSDTKILILTVLGDRKSVLSALKAGADGYVLKDAPAEQIKQHLTEVLNDAAPISPRAAAHLLHALRPNRLGSTGDQGDNAETLTDREHEILRLFERGLSYLETANALGISHNTVRSHVKTIYGKLSVTSRSEAIFEARQMGILEN